MYSSTISLNFGARWGWVVNATPRPLYPCEWPSTHCIGAWVGSRAGLNECGKLRHHQKLRNLPNEFKISFTDGWLGGGRRYIGVVYNLKLFLRKQTDMTSPHSLIFCVTIFVVPSWGPQNWYFVVLLSRIAK